MSEGNRTGGQASRTGNYSAGSRSRSAAAARKANTGAGVKSTAGSGRTHSGSGTSARSGSASRTGTAARRHRHRRQGPDIAKILLILIAIVIVILCAAVGFKSCGRDGVTAVTEPETTEPETEIEEEITVNGISIHGLTKTEAEEKVLNAMDWSMKIKYGEEERELPNLLEENVRAVIEEALDKGEAGEYTVSADGLDEAIAAQVTEAASAWNKDAKNGSISSYDKSTDQFVFSGAENGIAIKEEELAAAILDKIKAGEYQAVITAEAEEVAPEVSEEQAKANFKRLGTCTTTTTSNKDRNENIRIASSALNGMIIQPGETFSFNQTTGNRTTDKGYRPAGAYSNGVLVEEPGGGVCQVSSTLYNAVVFSGLKTTERHAHSYEPSYVTPGEDAMVSYDGYSGPDMKFVNNSKSAVAIKTSFSNQKLTISIYGYPILEEGVTLSMHSEKIKDLDPPAPEYIEDPYMETGVEQVVKAAKNGSRWETNLVTKKDGVVVSDELLHTSTYSGKAATIKRNTSGTVQTSEGDTSAAASTESTTAAEATTAATATTAAAATSAAGAGPGATEAPAETTTAASGPGAQATSAAGTPEAGNTGGPGSQTTAAVETADGSSPISPLNG